MAAAARNQAARVPGLHPAIPLKALEWACIRQVTPQPALHRTPNDIPCALKCIQLTFQPSKGEREFMGKCAAISLVGLLFTVSAWGQLPSGNVFFGYSYTQTNLTPGQSTA